MQNCKLCDKQIFSIEDSKGGIRTLDPSVPVYAIRDEMVSVDRGGLIVQQSVKRCSLVKDAMVQHKMFCLKAEEFGSQETEIVKLEEHDDGIA